MQINNCKIKFSQVSGVCKGFVTNKILTVQRIFNFQKIFVHFLYSVPKKYSFYDFFVKKVRFDQIFLIYFFCFSFYNLYYLEKNFVSSYNSKIRIVNQYFLLWSNFLALFIILDTWSMFKFSQQMLNLLVIYCFLFQGQQWLTKNT